MSLAISLINGYQRYLSPHKGFCCAYRAATGEPSCSEYAKIVITDQGFWAALTDIRQRFRDCKTAASILNESDDATLQADKKALENREKIEKRFEKCAACPDFGCGSMMACDACSPF